MDQSLSTFGWNEYFTDEWEKLAVKDAVPARVIADFGTSLKLATPTIITAELSGRMAHYSNREHVPKVGDWVAVTIADSGHAVIIDVVPRHSEIARKIAGNQTVKQVIAANIDIAFVLISMNGDFSVERLKRFLYQLSINNIQPIIVLTKADKTNDSAAYISQLKTFELPIITSSSLTGEGMKEIRGYITPAKTAILLGSSGVGKSTLTNNLLGRDAQQTQEVRSSDSTGKHTTIHREIFILPNGGLLIDTPGIRELQLWGTEEDLDENFDDVASLISECLYTTCQHGSEKGCAVQAAIHDGELTSAHFASYNKMKRELATLKTKSNERSKWLNKKSKKKVERQVRDLINDEKQDIN
ncbi:MAG: ribosome small subunit-dependent GTPase A [Candidatus Saccharimonadales bacterium]